MKNKVFLEKLTGDAFIIVSSVYGAVLKQIKLTNLIQGLIRAKVGRKKGWNFYVNLSSMLMNTGNFNNEG